MESGWVRRHLVTKGSFYERLAVHGHEIVVDDDFAHLYADGRGRPSVPPSVMVRALLCATHDRTSDRETSRRTRVDLDWKAALGVLDDFEGIGATTFSLFRARLVAHDADMSLFEATLAKAVAAGVLKGKLTAIIDSSPVHGAGAVADTYELIRGFLIKVARAAGDRLAEGARDAAEPFCGAKPDIDWQDPAARKNHLQELVEAAGLVLGACRGLDDETVRDPAELLGQVIGQDLEVGDDGDLAVRHGVAPDRVISHSDPEMRHGRKSASRRFDGHKLDVISDEDSELVLGVDVRAGNASDGDGAASLLANVQDVDGVDVETLLGDMAYSDGDVREAVEAEGAEMVAKVPPVTNQGRFPKTAFGIDLDTEAVTCPAGNTTTTTRATKDHKGRRATLYLFPADMCGACPLQDQCTNGRRGRQITVGRHEARIAAARIAQDEPGTRALLRRRSKVERKIDHLQDLGMRQARYRGRRRTRLQALLAATVANFKRLVVLDAFPGTPASAV
ncbi:MAG: IS1182 family transposase [Acidimicrobiia bacterium]|nr:IS1182 family transposase [Acidimicrobiia bacterium]